MAHVQNVRELAGSSSAPALNNDDREDAAARRLSYEEDHLDGQTGMPEDPLEYAAELGFEEARTPSPTKTTGGTALLDALREALPYWGQGENVEANAQAEVLNCPDDVVDLKDPVSGDTPLLLAAQYGAGDLVELLVERGADVNAQLPSGATALHYMTNQSTLCPAAVRALLRFGADPNVAEQHTGATALHYAVRKARDGLLLFATASRDAGGRRVATFRRASRHTPGGVVSRPSGGRRRGRRDAIAGTQADAGALGVVEDLVTHGADARQRDFGGYDAAGYASGAAR